MENTFTAAFVKDGDWYMAYVEELPGANTQGKTIEEAQENLKEAAELYLESMPIPKPSGIQRPPLITTLELEYV